MSPQNEQTCSKPLRADVRPNYPCICNQMARHRVFPAVEGAVHEEIKAAQTVLQSWAQLAPTSLLLGLCAVLQRQVASLREPTPA